MGKLTVESISPDQDRTLPIFAELDEISDRIRDRAFQLFSDRGFRTGRDLDDWLEAERLICWPTSELVEHENEFRIDMALAGFRADDIAVTATPAEIIVKAEREEKKTDDKAVTLFSEFRSDKAFRRFGLPDEVDADRISVQFRNGMLEIRAPKAGTASDAPKKTRKAATKKKTAKKAAKKKTASKVSVKAKK